MSEVDQVQEPDKAAAADKPKTSTKPKRVDKIHRRTGTASLNKLSKAELIEWIGDRENELLEVYASPAQEGAPTDPVEILRAYYFASQHLRQLGSNRVFPNGKSVSDFLLDQGELKSIFIEIRELIQLLDAASPFLNLASVVNELGSTFMVIKEYERAYLAAKNGKTEYGNA